MSEDDRYAASMQSISDAILTTPGDTAPSIRQAIEARAYELGGQATTKAVEVPPELSSYVDKIARHAYKVTDEDIETLHRVGYSEDALFEITLSAALGAGLARLDRGLTALEKDK